MQGGRAGQYEVEAREAAGVDLVEQLAQRVEAAFADVATDPLERLDLVKDQHEAGAASVAQHAEQAGEEAERAVVVEVALDAGLTLDGCGDVGLAAEPRDQSFGDRVVAGGDGVTYADLMLYDVVEWMWSLDGELKDAYPKLRALHGRVGELPAIKAYVARKDGDKPFIDRPFTPSKLG